MDFNGYEIGKRIIETHVEQAELNKKKRELTEQRMHAFENVSHLMQKKKEGGENFQASLDETEGVYTGVFDLRDPDPNVAYASTTSDLQLIIKAHGNQGFMEEKFKLYVGLSTRGERTEHFVADLTKPELDSDGIPKDCGLVFNEAFIDDKNLEEAEIFVREMVGEAFDLEHKPSKGAEM